MCMYIFVYIYTYIYSLPYMFPFNSYLNIYMYAPVNGLVATGNSKTFPITLEDIYQIVGRCSTEQLDFHCLFLYTANS